MTELSKETADQLEGLAVMEEDILASLLEMQLHNLEASGLDPRTYSLVKIAALIALDAPPASYIAQVEFAREAASSQRRSSGCSWPSLRRSACRARPPRRPS